MPRAGVAGEAGEAGTGDTEWSMFVEGAFGAGNKWL